MIEIVGDQLANVGPGSFNVLGHLRYCRPVVIHNSPRPAQHGAATKPVGKTDARTEVRKGVVGNFSTWVDHDMSGQRAISRDARSEAPHTARRGEFLEDICAAAEIKIPGFDSALLTDGGVRSVWRNKGAIVAEAKIEGQLRSGLPGVLNEQTQYAAGASRLMHISTVSAIRNIQQEGRQRTTRLLRALGVPCLTSGESKRSVGEGALKLIAGVSSAKLNRVIANDFCQISANLMTVRCLGNVGDVLPAAGVAADSGTRNQRAASGRGESADETTGKTNRRDQPSGWVHEARR